MKSITTKTLSNIRRGLHGTLCFLTVLLSISFVADAQPARPRLVVGIVVDQMRWDYLYTYHDMWSRNGAFNRLLDESFLCNNTMVDYVPTVTACGHATIYTGTTPAFHGIAGNSYYIDGKSVNSVWDPDVTPVGTEENVGRQSPRNLLATTIGDQLKVATEGKAIVAGVSLKDRASILPAGHGADAAFWYDTKGHRFITSNYYMDQLPQWLTRFNERNSAALATNLWDEPSGITMTTSLAIETLRNLSMGKDDVTDLLAVSYSTTDACSHNHGVKSDSVNATYKQLDIELSRLLDVLDREVGRGEYLLFLTADHGGTYNMQSMRPLHLPWKMADTTTQRAAANEVLQARYGIADLLVDDKQYSVYLNNEAIATAGLDRDEVAAEACRALQADSLTMWAVDLEHLDRATIPVALKERLALGYARTRSGEIHLVHKPGVYTGSPGHPGSSHGTFTQDDTHIPLLFYGWHVNSGETARLTHMTDIAPTVCAMLHIQAPNACIGVPVSEVVK